MKISKSALIKEILSVKLGELGIAKLFEKIILSKRAPVVYKFTSP